MPLFPEESLRLSPAETDTLRPLHDTFVSYHMPVAGVLRAGVGRLRLTEAHSYSCCRIGDGDREVDLPSHLASRSMDPKECQPHIRARFLSDETLLSRLVALQRPLDPFDAPDLYRVEQGFLNQFRQLKNPAEQGAAP
jgi:hypothetical protein